MNDSVNSPVPKDEEVHLLDHLLLLAKHSRVIIYTTLAISVLTLVILLIIPNQYTAVARLLPPQQNMTLSAQLLDSLGGAAIPGAASGTRGLGDISALLGVKAPGPIYVSMMSGNNFSDRIIERFKLRELYNKDYIEEVRKKLSERVELLAGEKEGIISIEVTDEDPQRAADMANAYVEELDKLLQKLAVQEAFCAGLSSVRMVDYDFIFKIDADIVLGPKYFQGILNKFASNARLGIATGEADELIQGHLVRMRTLPLGFNGMIKGWRKACFQEIGGIPKGPGWDGIDCYKAMMLGWQTVTFEDEDLRVVHLRQAGSTVINMYHGWAKHGHALHFIGAHPLWLLASAFYHLADRPYVLGSLCLLIEFLEAWLGGAKRYEDQELREYVRAWQRKKLAKSLKLA